MVAGLKSGVARGFGRLSDRGGGSMKKGDVLLLPPGVIPGSGWVSDTQSIPYNPKLDDVLYRSFFPVEFSPGGQSLSIASYASNPAMTVSVVVMGNGSNGYSKTTKDGGRTWSYAALPFGSVFELTHANGMWVCWGGASSTRQVAYSLDDGATWTLSPTAMISSLSLQYSFYHAATDTLFISDMATSRRFYHAKAAQLRAGGAVTWTAVTLSLGSTSHYIMGYGEANGKLGILSSPVSSGGSLLHTYDTVGGAVPAFNSPTKTDSFGYDGARMLSTPSQFILYSGVQAMACDGVSPPLLFSLSLPNLSGISAATIGGDGWMYYSYATISAGRLALPVVLDNSVPVVKERIIGSGVPYSAAWPVSIIGLTYNNGRVLGFSSSANRFAYIGDMIGMTQAPRPASKADWVAWTRYE